MRSSAWSPWHSLQANAPGERRASARCLVDLAIVSKRNSESASIKLRIAWKPMPQASGGRQPAVWWTLHSLPNGTANLQCYGVGHARMSNGDAFE
jgi:hypothetical protein